MNSAVRLVSYVFIVLFGLINFSCSPKTDALNINKVIKASEQKYKNSISAYQDVLLNPRNANAAGEVHFVKPGDWCSGFYPGCLWYLYELTGESLFNDEAAKRTELLSKEQYNASTHDMGFKMYCSYGNGFRLTNDSVYKNTLLQSAKTLITRFNTKVGCIRSWDHHEEEWQFPVIIDNMMNLELLFWAFRTSGDSTYYKIAVSHANKTLKNHFRSDYSSYHVVDYDTLTGDVIQKNTHQGYNHESAWARGQAWGLYGFTMLFRETRDTIYLKQAEHIADFIFNHKNLPTDKIPYWDFNAPNIPNEPRDASAAAIISSALFELSGYSELNREFYCSTANNILTGLASDAYFAEANAPHHFLLEHSTGNWPKNSEIDEPIIYADYYFLEALLRKQAMLPNE